MRIALVNPNTSAPTTDMMVGIAAAVAGKRAIVKGVTAPQGVALITTPSALKDAAQAVEMLAPTLDWADTVVIAAFGDPGLLALRQRLVVPVTGLAEAGMAEADRGGRRFAVVTTTSDLRLEIEETAARYGCVGFAGTWITPGDPARLAANPVVLQSALKTAIAAAVSEGGVDAVLIGGGPLAEAARALVADAPVPLIEPLTTAIHCSIARVSERLRP